MARKKSGNYSDEFDKPMRNRGEELNEPRTNYQYDYRPENQYTDRSQERSIRRNESRNVYEDMYDVEQRNDQRAFERLKNMQNEFYAGIDPRRRVELAEGGMVREDQSAMANLPRKAIHCEYPQASFYQSPYIDDTVRGTQEGQDDDGSSMARYLNPYYIPEAK